jgi:hypothetical protein
MGPSLAQEPARICGPRVRWMGIFWDPDFPNWSAGQRDASSCRSYRRGLSRAIAMLAAAQSGWGSKWFNTSAFKTPPSGQTTPPSARPGAVRLPGYWRSDLGLFKNIKATERFTFQLRAEAFNAFNHTNPVCCASFTSTNTSSFGVITSDRGPRTMELGAKFLF